MNFSVVHRNLVRLGFNPVALEITMLEMITLLQYGKNRHITPNISEYPGLTFIKFTDLVGIWVEMINMTFVLWPPKQ